jgi:hypothetical protein
MRTRYYCSQKWGICAPTSAREGGIWAKDTVSQPWQHPSICLSHASTAAQPAPSIYSPSHAADSDIALSGGCSRREEQLWSALLSWSVPYTASLPGRVSDVRFARCPRYPDTASSPSMESLAWTARSVPANFPFKNMLCSYTLSLQARTSSIGTTIYASLENLIGHLLRLLRNASQRKRGRMCTR